MEEERTFEEQYEEAKAEAVSDMTEKLKKAPNTEYDDKVFLYLFGGVAAMIVVPLAIAAIANIPIKKMEYAERMAKIANGMDPDALEIFKAQQTANDLSKEVANHAEAILKLLGRYPEIASE